MIKEMIEKIDRKSDLSQKEAESVMEEIMTGNASPEEMSAFLLGLRKKGEAIDEITGAARIMRKHATKINVSAKNVLDTCGTGGDGAHTFNISTISAFVAAGAGVVVAKHGNRSVSSKCGSADILKALGANIECDTKKVEACIAEVGIGFLFAPLLHGAMKHAMPVRKKLGVRTIFNILGPLTNPAGARHQLLGVFDGSLTKQLADVLGKLGSTHVLVVHGDDGLDEVTTTTDTVVSELIGGAVKTYKINPRDFGIKAAELKELIGGDVSVNKRIAEEVLAGKKGPHRDIVILNAGCAIYAADKAKDMKDGIDMAAEAIDSGKALQKLKSLIKFTNK